MLRRVYFPKENEVQAYADVLITPEWTYLTEFRKWFESQIYEPGWHLEKDLLVKGNFIYCPEHCIFVPQEINKFLTKRSSCRGKWPLGVSFKTANNKWDAKLSIDGKSVHLGLYDNPDEAFYDYKKAKEKDAIRLAKKWKGRIDDEAYYALMDYEVDIHD